jgi:hypothetical protein
LAANLQITAIVTGALAVVFGGDVVQRLDAAEAVAPARTPAAAASCACKWRHRASIVSLERPFKAYPQGYGRSMFARFLL